jgi:hypothetical protein
MIHVTDDDSTSFSYQMDYIRQGYSKQKTRKYTEVFCGRVAQIRTC